LTIAVLAAAILPLIGYAQAQAQAQTQTLRIGVRAAMTTADPASSFNPDRGITLQVYEPLLLQDANVRPVPGLAVSWSMRDPTTWAFKLRPGVLFSDGTPLTPADVVFSVGRIRSVDITQSYKSNLRDVLSVEAEGADTVVFHTRSPAPTLPADLATFPILSARAASGAAVEEFNGGRASVGTGPFRLVKWSPGQGAQLERNERYWGPKPPWDKLDIRFIPNDSARVAALISGDLDVADALPAELLDRVKADARFQVTAVPGLLMMYLQPDIGRAATPYATDADGKMLARNPLRALKVRQAINLAINRTALAQRAMQGTVEPAGQFLAPGLDNHVADLAPVPFDPKAARALLAEAGYPQGFGLTVSCTNDRYAGDDRICQALGQMLTAVGIRAKVDTGPMSILLRRRAGGGPENGMDLSLYMIAYGPPNGLATASLSALAETQDRTAGRGANNFSGYSNPALDTLIRRAEQELDPAKRAELVEQASRMAMAELPMIPVVFTKNIWGLRKALTLVPRADGFTFAADIKPAD